VFEWHHVDPTQKERLVSEMLNRWSLPSIKKEIAKCILLCANCHRIVTHNEKEKLKKIQKEKKKLTFIPLDV
jgi:predicted HNH restriction endonuclease